MVLSVDNIKVLVIEDDATFINTYKDITEIMNKQDQNYSLKIFFAKTSDEAESYLYNKKELDFIIIDLKLDTENEIPVGIDIFNKIQKYEYIPTIVYSSFTDSLEDEVDQSCILKVYKKTDVQIDDILKEIKKIYSSGITEIFRRGGEFEKNLREIFWNQLSSSLDHWLKKENSSQQTKKRIIRYVLNNLHERFCVDEDGMFDKYDEAEVYIMPPLRKKHFTGDLVKKEEKYYVILTPACDLHNEKTEVVLLAEIKDLKDLVSKDEINEIWEKYNQDDISTSQKEKLTKKIKKIISNGKMGNEYHFLPPYKGFAGGYINFQNLLCIPKTDLSGFTIEANITTNFSKDIISRFSSYYARQGQPDFEIEEVFKNIHSTLN